MRQSKCSCPSAPGTSSAIYLPILVDDLLVYTTKLCHFSQACMNMYSSAKLQVSDTKEYQDFLQMYTGKTKTRETGNVYVYTNLYLILIHLFLLIRVRTCWSNLETRAGLQSPVEACWGSGKHQGNSGSDWLFSSSDSNIV
jgi:hypothetical protein